MYTNSQNIPLSMAVWLAHDSYDGSSDPNYISATGLLKPTKQIVLSSRVPQDDSDGDIADLVASRIGTAIHDAIEGAWVHNFKRAFTNLGIAESVSDRVLINPTSEELAAADNPIPVYMENRRVKEIAGFNVGGKYDLIAEGRLEDYKSTKTYSYMMATNTDDYTKQASIYRWLNQDIVTAETFAINFIFTDWLRSATLQDPNYPKTQVLQKEYPLLSVEDTEAFITAKLNDVTANWNKPESELVPCTDEELWRGDSKWKYYKNPQKMSRSTKNFDNAMEAHARLIEDKSVGVVVEAKGQVRRCNYCPGINECTQKDAYIANGTLTLF